MKLNAEFVSVWDGGYQVYSNCTVDLASGIVDPEISDDPEAENVEVLDYQFIALSGLEIPVEDADEGYKVADLELLRSLCSQLKPVEDEPKITPSIRMG